MRHVLLCLCCALAASAHAAESGCALPGQYVSSPWGFSTNSFWIAGDSGSVLIDTQFLPSATQAAVARAQQCTGKPVVAALVLHPNPDKFNGTQWLDDHGVEVLSSQAVIDAIPAVDTLRRRWFEKRYQPDYPDALVLPKAFGDVSMRIERGGAGINLYVLGPAVSGAQVVADWNGHVFVGDLVANGHHAWLELGQIQPWIDMLEFIQGLRPLRVYPGRGAPGGPELLTAQIDYLRFVRERVVARQSADAGDGKLDDATRDALVAEVVARYPGYGNDYFLQLGIPAVWDALAKSER